MKVKLSLCLAVFALVFVTAASAAPPVADAPVLEAEGVGMSVDCQAPTVEESAPEALLEGILVPEAQQAQAGNCCTGLRQACEAGCQPTGVFEFNCDPATCDSVCVCNIG